VLDAETLTVALPRGAEGDALFEGVKPVLERLALPAGAAAVPRR
jgi:hypothetical protein